MLTSRVTWSSESWKRISRSTPLTCPPFSLQPGSCTHFVSNFILLKLRRKKMGWPEAQDPYIFMNSVRGKPPLLWFQLICMHLNNYNHLFMIMSLLGVCIARVTGGWVGGMCVHVSRCGSSLYLWFSARITVCNGFSTVHTLVPGHIHSHNSELFSFKNIYSRKFVQLWQETVLDSLLPQDKIEMFK